MENLIQRFIYDTLALSALSPPFYDVWLCYVVYISIDPYSVIQEAFALSANLAFPHGQMEGQAFLLQKTDSDACISFIFTFLVVSYK